MGFTYVLTSQYLPDMIKIGETDDPDSRLVQHKTSLPGAQYALVYEGGRTLEQWLHKHFAEVRVEGEWFLATAEDVADAVRAYYEAMMRPLSPHEWKQSQVRSQKQSVRVLSIDDPKRVFKDEIAAGELPSLRQVKERMHLGTDRARAVLAELASAIPDGDEVPNVV